MANIEDIEGIGPSAAAKLREMGITSVEKLLAEGGSPKGRQTIEQTTGLSGKQILRWVNHADLYRIKGVAAEMSELLEAAGVDSVVELARRNAANLTQAMAATNEQKKLVRRVPTEAQVAGWIEEAKSLPRAVTH
jgi:predicted flap endonuclease-1-like 5' DNA nuclease